MTYVRRETGCSGGHVADDRCGFGTCSSMSADDVDIVVSVDALSHLIAPFLPNMAQRNRFESVFIFSFYFNTCV